MARPTSAQALTGLLAGAGVMHFVTPGFFDAIVPKALPNPRFWTYASGVAELAVAAAVAKPSTRRLGATAAAALFVGVFPANIQGALDAKPGAERVVTYARLPLQVPLVAWALKVRKQAAEAA
ncbi:hypothetical protein KSP35_13510 [Aquihabitans sp. G128]|uniref:DoxX family protein n=1 Tax=Aquihabitans sp. G128 TaxID=2849779 RepID=UPI001C246851|nr:hypothetical protein [Aquihabitans sp. G128]QXC59417.1 hypothetical protein KSP35_13510 [Aquihabitans sp. G128]